MTAALSRHNLLLGQLLEFARNGQPPPCMCFRSTQSHVLKAFTAPGPLIALPLLGRKQVLQDGRWLSIEPGAAMLVSGVCTRDVQNLPDPESGEYLAVGFALDDTVLGSARQIVGERLAAAPAGISVLPVEQVLEPLLAWSNAVREGRPAMACHALVGLVLQLYEAGHHALLQTPPPSLSARIRAMVAGNPAREWSSADIEDALGMSGASVRRHLASEGSGLRQIITEARLAHALELLYTTRLPLKSVAQRVGYASPSSFVKRFAERYGVEPSRVGA